MIIRVHERNGIIFQWHNEYLDDYGCDEFITTFNACSMSYSVNFHASLSLLKQLTSDDGKLKFIVLNDFSQST
jgi:hypothetical protein